MERLDLVVLFEDMRLVLFRCTGCVREAIPSINVAANEDPVPTKNTHPATLNHPQIQDSNGTHRCGEIIATQWYCPPALHNLANVSNPQLRNADETYVGYADKNSARLLDKQTLHMPDATNPHNTAEGPPDGNATDNEAESAVHELRIAKARPSIDLKAPLLVLVHEMGNL